MSLRVTQASLYDRAYRDIQRGLNNYARLQHEVATGRRINRPSDDPSGALRVIPLENELRHLSQLGDNVALARETLDTGAAALEDASGLMARARELATQAANGTISPGDRRSISAEIDQMLQQVVGIGNSRRGDRYLFGGTITDEAPFAIVQGAGRTRVEYRGNRDSLSIEVAPGVDTQLNIPGDGIFLQRQRGATTFTPPDGAAATGARPTGRGDTGVGFQDLTVAFAGLHTDTPGTITAGNGTTNAVGPLSYTFTTSPAALSVGGGPPLLLPITDGAFTTADGRTISLTVSGPPAQLTGTFTARASLSTDGGRSVRVISDFSDAAVAVRNGEDGSVLNIDVRDLARTGSEQVKYVGTFDIFTTLIALRDLLRNSDELPDAVVQQRITQLLPEVDNAHDAVLDGLRELGFRSSSTSALGNRVTSMRIARAESLSLVQDTDLAEAILAMQRQDMSYQAALQVGARVIQTSLQGFLR